MGEWKEIAAAVIRAGAAMREDGMTGIAPRDLADIVGRASGRGSRNINLYPGMPSDTCYDLAVFVSLRSPEYTRSRRGHLVFAEALQLLVRHMQGACTGNTRTAVLVCDEYVQASLDFWRPNLRTIMQDAQLELYLIEGVHVVELPV
ncbi:MAG: hypothetical protein J7D60_10045 [Prosthecochloris sp.]|nr:hypothetical protein [Prosthecochloris sp.]